MTESTQPVQNSPGKFRPLATIALIVSIMGGVLAIAENRCSAVNDHVLRLEAKIEEMDKVTHDIKEKQVANEVTHSVIAVEIDNLKVRLNELKAENTLQHTESRQERHDIEDVIRNLLIHEHEDTPGGG